MLTSRRRVYVLIVFVLTAALVIQPLPGRDHVGTPRVDSASGSNHLHGIVSALAVVPHALGAAASHVAGFVGRLFGGSDVLAAAQPSGSPSPSALASPDAPNEIVAMRSRHAKFFRNSNGSTRMEIGHDLHYLSAPGRWDDVDLNFRSDGADQVVDRNAVIVRLRSSAILATEAGSGKGIQWLLPEAASVSKNRASFRGQGACGGITMRRRVA